jgi:hypothetical protein
MRLLAILWAAGCSSDVTQLVVGVDTDYAVPAELARVKAYTILESRSRTSPAIDLDLATIGMPFSFGVVPDGADIASPVMIVVEGYAPGGTSPLVTSRVRTGFIEGKSLYLPIFLAKSCGGISCASNQTCIGGTCEAPDQPPGNLSIFDPDGPLTVPRPDGGIPDGGVPDGGLPDAGDPDGGTPDGGVECDLPIDLPAEIGSVPIGFDPNRDVLASDLDGDGVVEFVIARGAPTGGSPFAVLDFDDCRTPVLTSSATFGELRQGFVASGDRFYSVERDKIDRWRYTGVGMLSQDASPFFGGGEVERLAFSGDGRFGLAVANIGGWGYHRIDPATGGGAMTIAPERPKGFSASFDGDRFLHADDFGLRRIDPPSVTPFGPVGRMRDPAIAEVDEKRYVATVANDVSLRIIVYKEGNIIGTSTTTFAAPIMVGPTASHDGNERVRFYVLLDDGTLTGCESDEDSGQCDIFASTRDLPGGEVDDKREILTAWIDADPWPDVVLVGKGGRVYFASGDQLATDAAPSIDLGDDTRNAPAIAPTFFGAYGVEGALLVVPHADRLSLVAWRGSPGASDRLWAQFRGDGGRSAQVP